MSCYCLLWQILASLYFTDVNPPPFKDRFWEVHQMINTWNSNMDKNFTCLWVACIDESMWTWLSQYTCPGFMVVPCKPLPYGNEYHMIACGELEVLFWVGLVEGKDQPPKKPKEYSMEHTKTVATVLWLTKPLFATGTVIIIDSGFCVLKVIVSLLLFGIYSSVLIKKWCYWPKDIFQEMSNIARHFKSKKVGDVDVLPSMIQGHCFFLFAIHLRKCTGLIPVQNGYVHAFSRTCMYCMMWWCRIQNGNK